MADVHLRYGWLWSGFVLLVVVGAGMMTSSDPARVSIGIALLLAPLIATALLLTVFYVQSRRQHE